MTETNISLAGVIAGDTSISVVEKEGSGLLYRGYAIEELAKMASFEEVAYLLIYGQLPNKAQLQEYCQKLISLRDLPLELTQILEILPPNSNPMDILRTICSVLGSLEPENLTHNSFEIANRLLALFPGALFYWYHYHQNKTRISTVLCKSTTTAGYFLELLHQEAIDNLQTKALDVSLILYAEHELNASTFAARVTASTLSDFYSCICSAIGTLRGPLHGGANEEALKLLLSFGNSQDAVSGVKNMLAQKKLIMGFGHRVYKKHDPRSDIIKNFAQQLAENVNETHIFETAETIEKVMWDEKSLFPNLDFYSAVSYYCCRIPINLYTPLFVISRTTGWTAHILEQRQNNKLIRPLANYVGPNLTPLIKIENRV